MSKAPDHRYQDTRQMIAALPAAELLSGGFSSFTQPTADDAAVATPATLRPPPRGAFIALLILAGIILGGALLYVWFAPAPSPPESPLPATAVKIEEGSVIKAWPRADPERWRDAAPAAASDGFAATPPSPDSSAQRVRLDITATPASAVIFLNNARVGQGACSVEVRRGGQANIRAEAPGHHPLRRQIVADQDMPLPLQLVPLKQPTALPEGDLQDNPYN